MEPRLPYLDHPGPIPFAHRGGAAERPENTMASFERAVGLGYRYLETDVHATADGVVIAFHDDSLDRVTDASGRVADLPWKQVSGARVFGAGNGTGEPIPRLEDVLDAWPEARVNIDAKHDAAVGPLVEVLERVGAVDRVCVTAFSDRRLARFRRLSGGRVCTVTGPAAVARLRVASLGAPTWAFNAACVQVPVTWGGVRIVDGKFLAAAHQRSMPVHVWTVDDEAEMDRLLDLGVDGIMSDRVSLLKKVLERRGQWA